jgi:hypothetical protein
MDVAGPLEEVDVEIRPGIVARLQLDERDRALLVPAKPEPEPKRKARPVAANKAAGTAPTK